MRKLVLILMLIAFGISSNAQPWEYKYANTLGGSDAGERPIDIILDENDNLIHAGNFSSSSINIASNIIDHGNPGSENENAFVASYANDGSLNWAKGLTGNRGVSIKFIKHAPNNTNYLFGDFTSDTLRYDNSIAFSDTTDSKTFLFTINPDGTLNNSNMLKALGTSANFMSNDVMVDENSNFYFSGNLYGDTLIIAGEDTLAGNSDNNSQIILGKYDAQGNLAWSFTDKVLNNTYSGSSVKAFDMDANSEIIAGGALKNNITSVIGNDTLVNIGGTDLLLAKFAQNGNPLWAKNFGTTNMEEILDVSTDENNNIFVFGKFQGDTLSVEGQELINDTSGSFASQFFIGKFNSSGTLQWMKKSGVGDSFRDEEWSIKTDAGDLYLMSSFVDSTLNLGNATLTSHGNHDLLLAKFDGSGNTLWAKNFGGADKDDWFDYELGNSTIFLTGNLRGEMVFGLDTVNQSNHFGFFTAQVDLSSGNFLDVKTDTTSKVAYPSDFEINNMELGNNGALYMNGGFASSGIELGNNSLNYYGGKDIFIAKQSRSYAIAGMIYDYSEQPVTSGMVYLFENTGSGSFQIIDSTSINAEAYYMFQNLDFEKYIVKAEPNSTDYPLLIPSYYSDAVSWKNALIIDTEGGSNHAANIYLREMPQNTGNANIDGEITEEDTKISKSTKEVTGKPVKGVSVILKGKKKADEDIYDFTKTNSQGIYEFNKVDEGSYSIAVDLPGTEQSESYEIDVVEGEDSYKNYDYIIQGDTIYISDSGTETDVEELSKGEFPSYNIYPNPASRYLYVEIDQKIKIEQISLNTVKGRVVYSKAFSGMSNRFRLNVENMESGIYFLRIITSKDEIVRKLIIQ